MSQPCLETVSVMHFYKSECHSHSYQYNWRYVSYLNKIWTQKKLKYITLAENTSIWVNYTQLFTDMPAVTFTTQISYTLTNFPRMACYNQT